jgi:hypothetical protein
MLLERECTSGGGSMERPATIIAILLLIIGGAVAALYFYYSEPGPGTARIAGLDERARVERFVARFDSLTDARLYPMVWRSGTFLKTSFNDDRSEWTLTVSPADWGRRDSGSKTDLSATLFTAFKGVRAQAGGDPGRAVLVIVSEDGEMLAEVSETSGTLIHR